MDNNQVFSEYLRAGLFEIGDADNRLEQLTGAVDELAAQLKDKPAAIRCYTLVALDANIPLTNSLLLKTHELLKGHWKGLEGKYPEPPRYILRGVMLSALYELGKKWLVPCRIVYYTISGLSQFIQFGREKPIIDLIQRELRTLVENKANEEWSLAENPAVPAFKAFEFAGFEVEEVEVDGETLKAEMLKAAGVSPQGHGPQNGTQYWPSHFASTASAAITTAVQSSMQELVASLSTDALTTSINTYFQGVDKILTDAVKSSFQSLAAVERRSKLLWWKESLYSATLGKGYREVPPVLLPVVMAIDLAKLLPFGIPASVDYLLLDTYRAVTGGAPKKQSLVELLTPFGEPAQAEILRPHLPLLSACEGRTTLTAFLAQVVHDQRQPKKLTDYTGLRAKEQASPDQLALLVLHDLLIERLIK
ncbi:MAG: GTPase-associated system all-helical protein GASH [Janthinobacterium lividum]